MSFECDGPGGDAELSFSQWLNYKDASRECAAFC